MFDIPMNTKSAMSLSDLANGQTAGQAQPSQAQNFGNTQPQGFAPNQIHSQQGGFNQYPVQNQNGFGQQAPVQTQNSFAQQPMQQPMQQNFNQTPVQPQVRQRPAGGGVIIKKGQKTSLSALNPNLNIIEVGLGWDLGPGGQAYDLDVEAFLLNEQNKVIGDDWFVFYNQPISPDGSVQLLEDSTNGAGDGDDEIIQVRLKQVNPGVNKILFIVTINEAKEHGYNFSNVQNAYVRIVDKSTNKEMVRFNLTDYYNTVCSMMVGEVYLKNGEWRFNPIGNGTGDDLIGLCARYGVNVAG